MRASRVRNCLVGCWLFMISSCRLPAASIPIPSSPLSYMLPLPSFPSSSSHFTPASPLHMDGYHPDDSFSDVDSDIFSMRSAPSSATSYDVSMRSGSPAPSMYSVTSSIRATSYRQEYGRGLNNYSEVYQLPADDEELDRLDKQHGMFKKIMGAYPPSMAEVMADDTSGEIKSVLDLGCGSGNWIMEVARDFPHCQAVAVDLVPMQSMQRYASKLQPCRSEVDDINIGLQHFYGDFNVVHARLISSGIRDFPSLIDHISQCLRPGGLMELLEFDFRVYDGDCRPFSLRTGIMESPWFPRWMSFLNMAVRQRGGSPDAASMLYNWTLQHPAFEDVVYEEYFIPTAPFMSHQDPNFHFNRAISLTFREDILAFLRSGRPLLLGSGLPESLVDELQDRAHFELIEARTASFIRVERVYARKRP
ncbi:S-adenosyl-L-methionine-dependent methyltransferase [Multifurca ochricompacta]|uniref:S-adenosyl-L-methionine-dependent methyltransferase n=1 Tax=Multifurca ochricompacta TaxID=376703 RepID=A0AAD4MEK7_9AGAM|nr:S-adenosyl-L-methionine-dependent methyltransferase [Multifurca ochricompacta]